MRLPRKGDRFLCIKDVVMSGTDTIAYTNGQTYLCQEDLCITDNQGDIDHLWDSSVSKSFIEHFEFINEHNKTIKEIAELYVENNVGYDNQEDKELFISVFIAGVNFGQKRLASEIADLFNDMKSGKGLEEAFESALSKNENK